MSSKRPYLSLSRYRILTIRVKLRNWRIKNLSLSNGIELIVPNNVYQDADSVEFIQNPDGTYSILIKNIEDIINK